MEETGQTAAYETGLDAVAKVRLVQLVAVVP